MTASLTAPSAVKILKAAIGDYNYWGSSESDSPLEIRRTKSVIDEKKLLSIDGSLRKAANPASQKPPTDRNVSQKSLSEVFSPLAVSALSELTDKFKSGAELETLETPAEAVEFYVQLYSAFKQLASPTVYYVDSPTDPLVGMVIAGVSSDGETVYAQSLLVQT